MRVWELAEELRVLSADVLELIKPHDAYVTSHLATVPRQALDAIRASPPEPRYQWGEYWDWHKPPSGFDPTRVGPPSKPMDAATQAARRRFRRRPGPNRISFEPPYEEDEDGYGSDTIDDLRYEPTWSTRDVATFYGVEPATVRQWVRRGHLHPAGKVGPSHVFDREDVYAATDAITGRRRKPARPDPTRPQPATHRPRDPYDEYLALALQGRRPRSHGRTAQDHELAGVGTQALHRLATITPDALVTTEETAVLLGLTASTIRSWVRRGHLTPAPQTNTAGTPRPAASRRPGRHLFRVADVYKAARR